MQFSVLKRLLNGQFFLTLLQKTRSLIAQNMNVDSFFHVNVKKYKKALRLRVYNFKFRSTTNENDVQSRT